MQPPIFVKVKNIGKTKISSYTSLWSISKVLIKLRTSEPGKSKLLTLIYYHESNTTLLLI
jgi:hypothetical protein